MMNRLRTGVKLMTILLVMLAVLTVSFGANLTFADKGDGNVETCVSCGDSADDAPPKDSRGLSLSTFFLTSSALSASYTKTFRTDTAPELDWYQPCDGGDHLIDFYINVHDIDVSTIKSARLTLAVWDVDYDCSVPGECERDTVYINGHRLMTPGAYLTGANNQWSTCTFNVEPEWIIEGDNYVEIHIDLLTGSRWCVECDWGELSVTLTKPPEIEEIIITPENPETKHDVTFEARITDAPGYEIEQTRWIFVIPDQYYAFLSGNPVTVRPPAGTHGNRQVVCQVYYRNIVTGAIDMTARTKDFKLFFERDGYDTWWQWLTSTPNWFVYWNPIAGSTQAKYDGAVVYGQYRYGESFVRIGPGAQTVVPTQDKPWSAGRTFIDCFATVVQHELEHMRHWATYGIPSTTADPDADLIPTWAEDADGDGQLDSPEETDPNVTITYPNLVNRRDNEYYATRAEIGVDVPDEQDWGNPGKQSDGVSNLGISTAQLNTSYSSVTVYDSGDFMGEVGEPTAVFSGFFSDVGLDTNGDGLYDYLAISIGLNITEAGNYYIAGELGKNGELIAWANNFTYLATGNQSIVLYFGGLTIRLHELDGPYNLTIIRAYDENGTLHDEMLGSYNTSIYNHTDFERQVSKFTDTHSDYGTDINGDGLYDYLTVEVGVNVTIAGNYTMDGYLYDVSENEIAWAQNSTYLDIGVHSAILNFDGISIYKHGIDGPYSLENVSLHDENSNYTDFVYDAHNTSAYSYTDFQSPLALLLDNYSDYGIDTNGDGMYEWLAIDVGVNVTTAGNYTITGYLSGSEIAWTSTTTYLDVGDQSLLLTFDGRTIYDHGKDGPYDLRHLTLHDENGTMPDYCFDAYTTSPYSYMEFQRPLVELTGNYSDYGTDIDSNGLYDYLTVDVEIIVVNAGNYALNARLMDENENEIVWAANSSWLTADVPQLIQLDFDGLSINKHGVNGPYYLRDIYVYNTADVGRSDYVYDAYTTAFYDYADFETILNTELLNVSLISADPTVNEINVSSLNLFEVDETYKPDEVTSRQAYVVNATGSGNFTLEFTDVADASVIKVYKVDPTSTPPNQWVELDYTTTANTVTFTMSVGDPPVVFAGPASTPPVRRRGGGGGGSAEIKYLMVDWDENITQEPLYGNGRLTVDLLGSCPDSCHSLLLEQGTQAPTVDGKAHYLIAIRELEETPPLPENTEVIVAFNVTPTGAVFDKNILLTLGFDEPQLPENAVNVTMAYYDNVNEVWVLMDSKAGGSPNTVAELSLSTAINHFTIFAVLVEVAPSPPQPPAAHFAASGLNIETSVETGIFVNKIGESVSINANVANDGGQKGTYTVELKLDGETVDTEEVTLGAGQSQQVSFTMSGLDYGKHEVEVAGLPGEFTTSRTITWWLIIVIIVAIGLIIWGVVWGRRRRRIAAQEG